MIAAVILSALFLAYANGANDNFKGVATLFGSRTTGYRRALAWATVTTFAGSLTAAWLSQGLTRAFSGKGLVPEAVAAQPLFLLAVGLGAAGTVYGAAVAGIPISTTHALTGALVGAGWMAAGPALNLGKLGQAFLLPLAVSPVLAMGMTRFLYPFFRAARVRLGIEKQLCLCIGPRLESVRIQPDGTAILSSTGLSLSMGESQRCVEAYRGVLLGMDCQRGLDRLHHLSAGAVGFARGLNDAPKLVALSFAAQALDPAGGAGLFFAVAVAMAAGGILSARRVAVTMSQRITAMNHGQGLTANLVTSLLVALASRFGLPVSTTHVACGALFGIGFVSRTADLSVIRNIVLAWFLTLPMAACLAGTLFWLFSGR